MRSTGAVRSSGLPRRFQSGRLAAGHRFGPFVLGLQPDGATRPPQSAVDGRPWWHRHVHHRAALARPGASVIPWWRIRSSGCGCSSPGTGSAGFTMFASPMRNRSWPESPSARDPAGLTGRRHVARTYFGKLLRRRACLLGPRPAPDPAIEDRGGPAERRSRSGLGPGCCHSGRGGPGGPSG